MKQNCVSEVLRKIGQAQRFYRVELHKPTSTDQILESFGIETITLTSAECLLTHHNELRDLPQDIYDSLLDITYSYAKNPALYGSSEHLLYLGRNKK